MHSFWGILWGEYTNLQLRLPLNLLFYVTKDIPLSSCPGNCKALKELGRIKAFFLPFLLKMKASLPHHILEFVLCRTRFDKLVILWCGGKLKTYHKFYFIFILEWIIWLINCSNSATSVLHGLSYASAIRGGPWWEKIHRSVLFMLLWRSWGLLFSCRWGKGVMSSPQPAPSLLHGPGWESERPEHPSQLSPCANAAAPHPTATTSPLRNSN